MNNFQEWIPVIISGLSLLVSLYTWYVTNQRTTAEIEIELKNMIDEKKNNYVSLLNNEDKIDFFVEEELNAYDKACSLYLDNKVHKKRFKQDYYNEIMSIFESDVFTEIGELNDARCKYSSLITVYDKWKKIK